MIKDLRELKKFLQLCRQQGVESIKFDGVEVHLGSLPQPAKTRIIPNRDNKQHEVTESIFNPGNITTNPDIIETDMPTEDQLLFGSSDPTVWNEKANQ